MTRHEEELELGGLQLRRFLFKPDADQPIRAAAMHFHGQGDYSERYNETLSAFTRQGVVCVSTDLPGHGRSEGKRGCIAGFDLIDQIARSNEERCRELCPVNTGPLGILGHSAGGLMTLRELLLRPTPYAFSWISSPLVKPDANQNPLLVRAAPVIARLVPNLTVPTGVTPDQCFHDIPGTEPIEQIESPEYFHGRVSVGWGYAMIEAAQMVRERLITDPPRVPLLLTQGSDDPVCPARYLRAILEQATIPRLSYREFEGALHEPFSDSCKAEVFQVIDEWLGAVLAETIGAQDAVGQGAEKRR